MLEGGDDIGGSGKILVEQFFHAVEIERDFLCIEGFGEPVREKHEPLARRERELM